MPQSISSVFNDIELWLRKRIESSDDQFLPSVRSLAAERNVSPKTMHLVLRKLAREGLLLVKSGKRTRIVALLKSSAEPRLREGAAWALCEKIRQSITQGVIRTGEPLPKIDYYTIDMHVCRQTVCRALRLLEKDGFVRKRGKRWIAGGKAGHVRASSPTVLFVVHDYNAWRNYALYPNELYFSLAQALQSELERNGYSVRLVYTAELAVDEKEIPNGLREIEELLKSLGRDYHGAVSMVRDEDRAVVSQLLSYRRPVAALRMPFSRSVFSDRHEYYTYLDIDWRDGVRKMMQALADKGHRVIAVPQYVRASRQWWTGWITGRVQMIQEESRLMTPCITVRVIEQDEDFWYHLRWRLNSELFAPVFNGMIARQQGNTSHNGNTREILTRLSPSLDSVIRDPRITAFVAPCDSLARVFGVWFRSAGVSIPSDLSLAGFDNDMLGRFRRYDTVDWGLAHLGYLGAHAIIGDIPLKIRKDRSLVTPCAYVSRGSVATVAR